jgi:integrase
MSRLRIPHVQAWVDRRSGRSRHRFRRRGFPSVELPGVPGSAEFMTAYQAATANAPIAIGAKRNVPGTVAYVVAGNLDSQSHFGRLAPGTQAMQRAILERFREAHGNLPFKTMPPKFVAWLLDQKKPHAARNWLKTIRALCRFAIALGIRSDDPARDIKLPKIKGGGHHTWTPDEIGQFEARHAIGTKARLAFALLRFTMQRRGDVIRMGRQHIRNGEIHVTQEKTGVVLVLPVHPELEAIIDATPGDHLNFITTKTGKPYSGTDFSEAFRAWCNEAGLPKRCTAHGLRKAGLTWGADQGWSVHELAAWGGHKTLKEIERYTKAADQRRNARAALDRTLGQNEPDTAGVTFPNHVTKTGS